MIRGEDPTVPFAVIVLEDDLNPRRLVSANIKLHRAVAGEVRAYWRHLTKEACRRVYGTPDVGCFWHQRVRVEIEVRWPDRRRHDVANLYSYVFKPMIDGLVDAGLVPDDDDTHLIGPDPRRDLQPGALRISLRIFDQPPA